jgi:adenylate kinase family enzyme
MDRKNTNKKFKFCYIMRGSPGSGKSTVAIQLAGENGNILTFDSNLIQ